MKDTHDSGSASDLQREQVRSIRFRGHQPRRRKLLLSYLSPSSPDAERAAAELVALYQAAL